MEACNIIVLGKTGCGKSSFLNAIIKNFDPNSKLLDTSDGIEGCTKDIEPVNIFYNNNQLYFYDTPGLDDGNKSQNSYYINLLREEGKKPENRINSILICNNALSTRFNAVLRDTIIEIINCFPLKEFWEHVIIINTHVFKDIYKKPKRFENAIKNNEDIRKAMNEKKINSPNYIEEFFFDTVDDDNKIPKTDDNIKKELKKLFNKIINTKPLYKNIKILNTVEEEDGVEKVKYEIREYIDFNDDKITKKVEIDRKKMEGPYYGERKIGNVYKKCGKKYQNYQKYRYYIDAQGNECNKYDVGKEYPKRV